MRIGRQEEPNAVTFLIIGELDFSTTERLRETVLQESPGKAIILDLRELEFIDSSGAGMLIQLARDLSSENGVLEIVHIPAEMREGMELIGFFDVLDALFSPHSTSNNRRYKDVD